MPMTNPCENLKKIPTTAMDRPYSNTLVISIVVETWPHIVNVNARESLATNNLEHVKTGDLEEEVAYISKELKSDKIMKIIEPMK